MKKKLVTIFRSCVLMFSICWCQACVKPFTGNCFSDIEYYFDEGSVLFYARINYDVSYIKEAGFVVSYDKDIKYPTINNSYKYVCDITDDSICLQKDVSNIKELKICPYAILTNNIINVGTYYGKTRYFVIDHDYED